MVALISELGIGSRGPKLESRWRYGEDARLTEELARSWRLNEKLSWDKETDKPELKVVGRYNPGSGEVLLAERVDRNRQVCYVVRAYGLDGIELGSILDLYDEDSGRLVCAIPGISQANPLREVTRISPRELCDGKSSDEQKQRFIDILRGRIWS